MTNKLGLCASVLCPALSGSPGITLTDRAPVQLELLDEPRNWEALARLEQRGFLLVTDKFPETIFAFVPYP